MTALPSWSLRAWGLDDPRVVSALAHENQAGRWRRQQEVGERAREAGWPALPNIIEATKQQIRRLEELEGGRWHHRAQSRRSYRYRYGSDPTQDLAHDDGPATIFDE